MRPRSGVFINREGALRLPWLTAIIFLPIWLPIVTG